MKTAFVALGSNLGDRFENLSAAVHKMEAPDLKVQGASRIYETEPREDLNQPWFLNQVVQIQTSLFPRQLLRRLKKIERQMGRVVTRPKGPRKIDLDLLFYDRAVIQTAEIEIPHPKLSERRFVLEPLAELAPELRHPVSRKTVREMLKEVQNQKVQLA